MSNLFFDTETTGLPKKNQHEDMQPHVVQLAATLTDDAGRIMSQINHIIKPEGWDIPKEASDVHGITMDVAMKYGISRQAVLMMFSNLVKRSDLLIAHNAEFDLKMLNLQYKRQGLQSPLFDKEVYCTADNSTDILKIPPTQRMKDWGHGDKFKRPTLQEAHIFFCSHWNSAAAHNAMYDVEACMAVYFKLKGMEDPQGVNDFKERQLDLYKVLHDWLKADQPEKLLRIEERQYI